MNPEPIDPEPPLLPLRKLIPRKRMRNFECLLFKKSMDKGYIIIYPHQITDLSLSGYRNLLYRKVA